LLSYPLVDGFSSSKNPRSHRANRATQYVCNIIVAQTFELSEHQGRSQLIWQIIQRSLQHRR
jgi:hypothetical protein